jgi:hypothetical protein
LTCENKENTDENEEKISRLVCLGLFGRTGFCHGGQRRCAIFTGGDERFIGIVFITRFTKQQQLRRLFDARQTRRRLGLRNLQQQGRYQI